MMAPPISLLFMHYGQNWIRGSEQCLLDLVRGLDRTRYTPTVACNAPALAHAVTALGAHAILTEHAAPSSLIANRAQTRALHDIARSTDAALIHANTSVLIPALVPVARARRVPLLAHVHIVMSASERRHLLVHQASMIVGVSQIAVEGLLDEGTPASHIRVIDNAVDAERIGTGDHTTLRARLGIAPRAVVAATLGSLIYRKAHDTAIRAVADARGHGVDAHLLLCGSGELESTLRALAESLHVTHAVHFLGFQAEAGAILRDAADVLLAPSRDEALPLNVLEAQWLGLPIAASDIPAHREALIGNASSIMVRRDDAHAMAVALRAMTAETRWRDNARNVTMPLARERFSMTRYVERFDAVYSELLRAPSRRYGWLGATRWPRTYSEWTRELLLKRARRIFRASNHSMDNAARQPASHSRPA